VSEGKASFETMSADIKELASAKSPTEFFEKQSALLRKQFDAVVATSSKNSEAFLKLANEAFQPISTRVSPRGRKDEEGCLISDRRRAPRAPH
jgi:phasin family protein